MNRFAGAFRATKPAFKPLARLPIMNRAKTGLYHGKHIMFGNYVAHSERKCRRTWLPNLQKHKYFSELLGKQLRLKLTTETMRCIDKFGGLDNYLLRTNHVLLGGDRSIGNELKKQVQIAFEQKQILDQQVKNTALLQIKLEAAIKAATEKAANDAKLAALKEATGANAI